MIKNKIFISHSSKDLDYVKSFVENILILGLDISSERIFCTSMEGHGIKSGEYVPDILRKEINSSSLALLFISKNYKRSEVCQSEVGAAWAVLSKENIIPLLLPDIDFNEIGFLNITRLGLKVCEKDGVLKLIEDCKELLNPSFNFEKLHNKIETYLKETQAILRNNPSYEIDKPLKIDEWTDCFTDNLYAFNEIVRQAIPANNDGIYRISKQKIQTQILTDLSKAKFLKHFWYKHAKGDYYVEQIKRIPSSGNWLLSCFNWEIKIAEMWLSMNSELQYEFILIKSEKLDPFIINSDVSGESYTVGILNDGTIVSENERLNGFAIINGEVIKLQEYGVEPRFRHATSNWFFLVSSYHKAGYNAEKTIEFCRKLDSGEIKVNEENILNFLRSLGNNPIVSRYR